MYFDDDEQAQIEILNNRFNLDDVCYFCVDQANSYFSGTPERIGKIKEEFDGTGKVCKVCNNKRFVPTDFGDMILGFIKRHKEDSNE